MFRFFNNSHRVEYPVHRHRVYTDKLPEDVLGMRIPLQTHMKQLGERVFAELENKQLNVKSTLKSHQANVAS